MQLAQPGSVEFQSQAHRLALFVAYLFKYISVSAATMNGYVNAVKKKHERHFHYPALELHTFHKLLISGVERKWTAAGKVTVQATPFTWSLVRRCKSVLRFGLFSHCLLFAAITVRFLVASFGAAPWYSSFYSSM